MAAKIRPAPGHRGPATQLAAAKPTPALLVEHGALSSRRRVPPRSCPVQFSPALRGHGPIVFPPRTDRTRPSLMPATKGTDDRVVTQFWAAMQRTTGRPRLTLRGESSRLAGSGMRDRRPGELAPSGGVPSTTGRWTAPSIACWRADQSASHRHRGVHSARVMPSPTSSGTGSSVRSSTGPRRTSRRRAGPTWRSASHPSPDRPRSAPPISAPRPLAACRCRVLWWARSMNLGRILMRLSRRLATITAVLALALTTHDSLAARGEGAPRRQEFSLNFSRSDFTVTCRRGRNACPVPRLDATLAHSSPRRAPWSDAGVPGSTLIRSGPRRGIPDGPP